MTSVARIHPPQAFISTYAPRIRTYGNALLGPAIQPPNQLPHVRTTKRGTTAINYAEDGFDDEDFDDSEGLRRPTGLRSLRRDEPAGDRSGQPGQHRKDLDAPVQVQGIWRDWMGKPSKLITEKQHQIQCSLPLNLVPIRIDLEIPSFRPEAPLPAPANARDFGIDESLPAYRPGEPTPAFSLKDAFLWNLHEALTTPDQFARRFVEELDFPPDRRAVLIMQITNQIRSQLEEHAAVALHPLFQSAIPPTKENSRPGSIAPSVQARIAQASNHAPSPGSTPINGVNPHNVAPEKEEITASAELMTDDYLNPDDTYRCVISLNVNLRNKLFSDKFEWSLLHPPGAAELFARQTCADMALGPEWVSVLSHAIYDSVLKLKREVCENGGPLSYGGEIDNEAAPGAHRGWRYDPETLGLQWEPQLEELTKEEFENRERDRERQLRRARRDTNRFSHIGASSSAAMAPPPPQNDYFNIQETPDQPMGRGERSKKKRRYRSLSPLGRDTPDAATNNTGLGSTLREDERQYWRCSHCCVYGSAVWAIRDGPNGPRTLCHNCGYLYDRDKRLPVWSKDFFAPEVHHASARR